MISLPGEKVYYDGQWWKVRGSAGSWLTLVRNEVQGLNRNRRRVQVIKKVRSTEVF